jgi:hypothetical protein
MLEHNDAQSLCISCRLTRQDQSAPEQDHARRWYAAESAKRRALYDLLLLRLSFRGKQGADNGSGLEFVWQVPNNDEPNGQPVLTGHNNGRITMNLLEADDDHREAARVALNEPQRSILGHLRHEISHHLHLRFVVHANAGPAFDAFFGPAAADYSQALQRHYEQGPPADWASQFISAYASMHPLEDWAETCAHHLLMVDTLETAAAWGLQLASLPQLQTVDVSLQSQANWPAVIGQQWLPLARFLNAMSRSIGVRDNYPFVLPDTVLNKLSFVQQTLQLHAYELRPGCL